MKSDDGRDDVRAALAELIGASDNATAFAFVQRAGIRKVGDLPLDKVEAFASDIRAEVARLKAVQ